MAKHGRQLGAMARVDLPAPTSEVEARALLRGLCRRRPDELLVVAYEDSPDSSALARESVRLAARGAGYAVGDEFVVRDGRVWSGDDRCGPEGLRLPHPADVPMVAELVALGMAPLASREEVETRVRPHVEGLVEDVPTLVSRPRRREAWRAVLRAAMRDGTVADRTVAGAAGSLLDRDWRDGLIAWMCPGFLPLDALMEDTRRDLARVVRGAGLPAAHLPSHDGEAILAGLCDLARRLPDRVGWPASGVLTMAGALAWTLGDGTLAGIAFQRALVADPGYRLAGLLSTSLDHGMPPPRAAMRPRPARRWPAQGLDTA